MTQVIAITNQKGGVGKTTTAVTFAAGAALSGKRVLLVDLDPQANVSAALGLQPANDLAAWLKHTKATADCTVKVDEIPGLDVIRSSKHTALVNTEMISWDFRELAIKTALRDSKNFYDLVIFDCAPSLNVMQTAAMVAATGVIIPTMMGKYSVNGLNDTIASLNALRAAAHIEAQLLGILPTFYDNRISEHAEQLAELARQMGSLIWPVIPVDSQLSRLARRGRTIWDAPNTRALIGFAHGGRRVGGYKQAMARFVA